MFPQQFHFQTGCTTFKIQHYDRPFAIIPLHTANRTSNSPTCRVGSPRRTEPNRTEHWANRTEVRFVSWRTRTETNSRSQCSVRGCSVRFALVWYNVVSRTVPNRHLWFV